MKVLEFFNNYDNFKFMTENAFNKAINNYTTQHFFEKFLKPIKF